MFKRKRSNSSLSKPFKPPRLAAAGSGGSETRKAGKSAENNAETFEPRAAEMSRTFNAVYRKKTTKKNKTWDGDAVLVLSATMLVARKDSADGQRLVSGSPKVFSTSAVFGVGNFEFEVVDEVESGNKENEPSGAPEPQPRKRVTLAAEKTSNSAVKRELSANIASSANCAKSGRGGDPDGADLQELAHVLRPHQVAAVRFMQNHLLGNSAEQESKGVLLADEMGLGKTLTIIAFIWTMLKRNRASNRAAPLKVLVVVPVTLLGNWKKEFKKWVGERLSVLALSGVNNKSDAQTIKQFAANRVYQVLLLGYERMMTLKTEIAAIGAKFDLLVCDEGHRLKNSSSKVLQFLKRLQIRSKILASGTPIQNDLNEFYTLMSFLNPNSLGEYTEFQKRFMNPILASREPSCCNRDVLTEGQARSEQLIAMTSKFVLRRTKDVIEQFLPKKRDFIVFVRPSEAQRSAFQEILRSVRVSESQGDVLALINLFRKVCNSVQLCENDKCWNERVGPTRTSSSATVGDSGKMCLLMSFLKQLRNTSDEKVVVVSNFTQTLDLIEQNVARSNYPFDRIDGSTPSSKRDAVINHFNKTDQNSSFVFLLSAKSGGVGLNLIGASRLILFDNDWNPANDLQAMARIHRDGQTKEVNIYRFVTSGCIDEKILQRQLMKMSLSGKFLDGEEDSTNGVFDMEDLKELFKIEDVDCGTHELMGCCKNTREAATPETSGTSESSSPSSDWQSAREIYLSQQTQKESIRNCLKGYGHLPREKFDEIDDAVLRRVAQSSQVARFVLSHVPKAEPS